MKDQNKTKQQLIEELGKLRKQNAGLERLSNEQKLEEEKYRSLVESAVDSVYVVDKDLRYTFMNKQNLSRLGLPINKVIGKAYGEFHTKEGTAKFKKRINNVFRTRRSKTHEYRSERDGKYFLRTYSPIIGAGGKPKTVTVFSKDISDLKKVEAALKKSEQELALHNKINQIFLTFPDKRIYSELLNLILEKLESKFGTFGYFNEEGSFIVPALTREIYWAKCQVSDKEVIFKRGTFSGIWARAIKERKILYSNEGPFSYPEGHVLIENTIVAPIIYENRIISAIHIANKKTGYDDKDRELLKIIANHVAPILSARIESNRREAKRKKVEEEFKNIFNLSPDMVAVCTPEGKFLKVNSAWEKALGYTKKEILDLGWAKLVHPDDVAQTNKEVEKQLKGSPVVDFINRFKCKDGSYKTLEWQATYAKEGIVYATARDITKRKQAEDALTNALGEWRVTFDSVKDLIMMLDADFKVSRINLATSRLLDRPTKEITGKTCYQLFHGTDRPPKGCPLEKMRKTKKHEEKEFYLPEKDIWILASVDPIFDDKGNVTRTTHILRDITKRKQDEDERKKYHANLKRLSTQLIYAQEAERKRISQELHDEIGQALTAVKINLATIVSQFQSDIAPTMMERLAEAVDLTDNLLDQIQNISLDLRPSMLDDLGLVPTLRWYIKRFEKRTNIKTQFKTVNVKERLHHEIETSIYRIVQEALTNVVKYAEADLVNINLKGKKTGIELLIEDNGRGFDLEKVISSPPASHGIGLLGIQERIAMLKGTTQLLTQPKIGTKIIINIPKRFPQ